MTRWLGAIFIAIASFSVWIFFSSKSTTKLKVAPTAAVDGYMVEAHYTEYDSQGQIHMVLYSPRMTHYAQDSTSYFDNPQILAYSQQRIPWTIIADHGMAIHDSTQVNLSGHVLIHQAAQPAYPETTIRTTIMTVFPHKGYAETDQPIVITRPDTYIDAIGLQANFKTGIFVLLSAVKASYTPHNTACTGKNSCVEK